jgi:hypothetical protein
MPAREDIRPHAYLDYPIDELCLGEAPNKHGHALDLAVYAYGEAEIAYDRDNDWEIVALRIDGRRRGDVRPATWLSDQAELTKTHPLYPVILAALHALSSQDIDDRVADVLASERVPA